MVNTVNRLVVCCSVALTLASCSSDNAVVDPDPTIQNRSFMRYTSASAFEADLRRALRDAPVYGGAPEIDVATDNAALESGDAGGQGGRVVTGTNVQEVGVDEADRVKVSSDGRRLFVLADENNETGAAEISCFAADAGYCGGAPVSSHLRVLSLDSETPQAQALSDTTLDLDERRADGLYLHGDGLVVTAVGQGGWFFDWMHSAPFVEKQGLIARYAVDESGALTAGPRIALDGQIISTRRIGDHLLFVSRYYPSVPEIEPFAGEPEAWNQAVDNAALADLLPTYRRDDESPRPLTAPDNCFASTAPDADQPYPSSADIITIGAINLGDMSLADSVCYLGQTETLYASPEAVVLATTSWQYDNEPDIVLDTDDSSPASDSVEESSVFEPRVRTDLHQFAFVDGALRYVGSGDVPGHLGWNSERRPYRMSMKDGYLRVATMQDPWNESVASPIRMTVLKADNGRLATVSTLPNASRQKPIGKPGESLYASRFVDDRAYLVTFRNTDPLYIIDLSDPRNPSVRGELEIEGYSDYLHPLGNDYLLGIGMDAVPGDGDERGGITQGMKLALFDARDPDLPLEVDSRLIGQRGTSSNALWNPRAIAARVSTDGQPARIALGINVHGSESAERIAPFDYRDFSRAGLYGFDISTDVNAGISLAGSLIVSEANAESPYPQYLNDPRAVMVDDAVFFVDGDRVHAAHWQNLAQSSGPR